LERDDRELRDVHDAIAQRLVTELADKAPMELVLRPATVFHVTALLQLACRHSSVSGAVRDTADRFLANVREYFADCPAALDLVRRGDDPEEDE
jgi:hypothetical protein